MTVNKNKPLRFQFISQPYFCYRVGNRHFECLQYGHMIIHNTTKIVHCWIALSTTDRTVHCAPSGVNKVVLTNFYILKSIKIALISIKEHRLSQCCRYHGIDFIVFIKKSPIKLYRSTVVYFKSATHHFTRKEIRPGGFMQSTIMTTFG